MPLPIYDIIEKTLKHHTIDSKKFFTEINSCSHREMEIFYGLILSFCEKEAIPIVYFPFNSRQTLDGIEFDLASLPPKLQAILFKFLTKTRA